MASRKPIALEAGWTVISGWEDTPDKFEIGRRRFKTEEEAEAYRQSLQPYQTAPPRRFHKVVEVDKTGEIV